MRLLFAGIFAVLLALAAPTGCAARSQRAETSQVAIPNSTLVYLVSGPRSGTGSPEARKAMFAGHMANINALASEGRLFIAGPFDAPSDRSWRGLFVLDATTAEDAARIAGRDPGVIAGEFQVVCHPMRAPEWLRELPEFDRRMTASAKSDPSQPPRNIRRYVIVTAASAECARRAIDASPWRDRVVWSGVLTETNRGVFVLDAERREELDAAGLDLGPCSVDMWWSSVWLAALSAKQSTR